MIYPIVKYGDSWYEFYRRFPDLFLKDMYDIRLSPYQTAILRFLTKEYKHHDNS